MESPDLDGGGGSVQLASAVVGHPDAVHAVLPGSRGRVLRRHHSLDDYLQLGHAAQPRDHLPRQLSGRHIDQEFAAADRRSGDGSELMSANVMQGTCR